MLLFFQPPPQFLELHKLIQDGLYRNKKTGQVAGFFGFKVH